MKIYLHGPRAGQSVKLQGVQFINGEAEVPKLSKVLEKFYNVKDYSPEDVQELDASINNEQENIVDTIEIDNIELSISAPDGDADILRKVVEEKKAEIESTTTANTGYNKDWKSLPWFTAKAYVKEMTGKSPQNMKTAVVLMAEAGYN